MDRHLTLVFPGLFGLLSGDAAAPYAPALRRLITRSDPVARPSAAQTAEPLLCDLFGVRRPEDGDLPIGAVSLLGEGGPGDSGWWLRADPVHLQPHGGDLVLAGNEILGLEAGEALRLAAELAEVLTPDRWRLETPCAHRWYLRLAAPARLRTVSLEEIRGRNIGERLPAGPDARFWHALLTEIQILLHASPLNAEREQRGRPSVNSLWFWGGGMLPQVETGQWTAVWSDAPLARGLGQLAGAVLHGLPEGAGSWLRDAGSGTHLVTAEAAGTEYGDAAVRRQTVELFEAQWVAPLLDAVRAGDVASVVLQAGRGPGRLLTRAGLRRWWRRPKPFPSHD